MKALFSFIAVLLLAANAPGQQQTVTTWRWNELKPGQLPPGATLVAFGNQTALKIVNNRNAPLQLSLLTIPDPKITAQVYAIQGEVRAEGFQGSLFMDLWSYFGQKTPQAARAQLHTSANWAPYSVPFNRLGDSRTPTRLQVDLLVNGSGTIYFGPLKLAQYIDANAYVDHNLGNVWLYGRTAHPWWSNRTGVRLTNAGTILLFALGLFMGGLCWKKKNQNLVSLMLKIHIGCGFVLGAFALTAIFREQPFAVWFPLLLSAIILIGVYRVWLVSLAKYYRST